MVVAGVDQHLESQRAVAEGARYTPPPLVYRKTVIVIGDSWTGGSNMNTSQSTLWWNVLSNKLPVNIQTAAIGGSGYVATNPNEPGNTFLKRATSIDFSGASAVVFFGSLNDESRSPTQIKQNAAAAYAAVKADAPNARLVVVGPQWPRSNPPADQLANSAAVHSAATAAGATWVDPVALGWFDTPSRLIGSDGVHPTDKGHAYLATKMAPIVSAAVESG